MKVTKTKEVFYCEQCENRAEVTLDYVNNDFEILRICIKDESFYRKLQVQARNKLILNKNFIV